MKIEQIASLQEELLKEENWRPRFSYLARKLKIPRSTMWEMYVKLKRRIHLKINIYILQEFEAIKKK